VVLDQPACHGRGKKGTVAPMNSIRLSFPSDPEHALRRGVEELDGYFLRSPAGLDVSDSCRSPA
jgi:hypothetical protein